MVIGSPSFQHMYVNLMQGGLLGIRIELQTIKKEKKYFGSDKEEIIVKTVLEEKFKWDGNEFVNDDNNSIGAEIKGIKYDNGNE